MPSKEVFNNIEDEGINLTLDAGYRYNKYDNLATSEDLCELFDVLSSVKDANGRNAVLTPVSIDGPGFSCSPVPWSQAAASASLQSHPI